MIQTSRDPRASRARRWLPVLLLSLGVLGLADASSAPQPADAPADAAQPAAAPGHDAPATPAPADHAATDPHTAQAAHGAAAPSAHGEAAEGEGHGEGHGESLWSFLSRIANFLILAGGLFYLLRSPLGKYLEARAEQIKADLVSAAETRMAAADDLAQIESRMAQLPAEIEALKARGVEEVRAEQERIRRAAAVERERLLEQARREIDGQLASARRVLKQDAADLAVQVARRRIEREITDADRARLVDRYVAQVKTAHD